MKIRELLLDGRINDLTMVIIKDALDRQITFGNWYNDNILSWGGFHAFLTFEEGNIAIFHLI